MIYLVETSEDMRQVWHDLSWQSLSKPQSAPSRCFPVLVDLLEVGVQHCFSGCLTCEGLSLCRAHPPSDNGAGLRSNPRDLKQPLLAHTGHLGSQGTTASYILRNQLKKGASLRRLRLRKSEQAAGMPAKRCSGLVTLRSLEDV